MATSCSACGKDFNSLGGFEQHRVGKYTNEHPHYGRRCLTTEELVEMGMVERGGTWRMPSDEGRAAWLATLGAQK